MVKSVCGYLRSASYMNFCHIWAGKVPPVTLTPCTSVMGMLPWGWPIQTVVERLGV